MSQIYGFVRGPDSNAYVDYWRTTTDAADMVRPDHEFVAMTEVTAKAVHAAFRARYPDIDESLQYRVTGETRTGRGDYVVEGFRVPILGDDTDRSQAWSIIEDLAGYTGPTPVVVSYYRSPSRLLRDIHAHDDYRTLPYTLQEIHRPFPMVVATRDDAAPLRRAKRRAAWDKGRQTKMANRAKKEVAAREHNEKVQTVSEVYEAAHEAAVIILGLCPALVACGPVQLGRGTMRYCHRPTLFQLRAAAALARRLAPKLDWRALPEVRHAAQLVVTNDDLVWNPKFDQYTLDDRHLPADVEALAWWRKEAKVVLRRLRAAGAARPPEPVAAAP